MWNDYFYQLQKKYNMRVSTKSPLVIRLDGKDVTKDQTINFIYKYNGSFYETFEKCAWYFSTKYKCYVLFGTDEINFVFPEPMLLIEDLDSDKVNHSNEIIALFMQYFFDYFNSYYKNGKIFFHGKCFSIPEGKITSYIKYRGSSIRNVITTYILKKNGIRMGKSKIEQRVEKCKETGLYEQIKDIEFGTLYFNGQMLDVNEFMNGNTVVINNNGENEDNSTSIEDDFEIEFLDM